MCARADNVKFPASCHAADLRGEPPPVPAAEGVTRTRGRFTRPLSQAMG